jgi:hypothetical protein
MNKDLEKFLEICEQDDFRNRDELLGGIRTGEIVAASCKLNSNNSCHHFIGIYDHREKHLRQFQTKHSERLRKDVLEMLERMSKTPDAKVGSWRFTKEPNVSFSIFINADTKEILGCIRGIDKRPTPEDEWEKIWCKAISEH